MHEAFQVHRLSDEGLAKAERLASAFNELLMVVEHYVGTPNRELALATTKLEEACFFAKKALAKTHQA